MKAEEYEHMALCLEDAMKETNELKSQVRFICRFTRVIFKFQLSDKLYSNN